MKILIIAEELRVTGTSEGIVSRSFIKKMRDAFPESTIDVYNITSIKTDNKLNQLPVDNVKFVFVERKIPFWIKLLNKLYHRLFHESLNTLLLYKRFSKVIKEIKYQEYDHVFVRSAGQDYCLVLGLENLPILKESKIYFHDPFPLFWDCGSNITELTKMELYKLKRMHKIVKQAKVCFSPAGLLSQNLEYLYGLNKKFFVVPHQFDKDSFDKDIDDNNIRKKEKNITISYHGAIQLGRNIDILLDSYVELLNENHFYVENTEFVLRLKQTKQIDRIIEKYKGINNIIFLGTLPSSESLREQANETDILIVLENANLQSDILVGKAPFLASLNKPILALSPLKSELRNILVDNKYLANSFDKNDVKFKLKNLIESQVDNDQLVRPFGDYFSLEKFKNSVEQLFV
jgi:glycosyltransferase involved in cell wall biosynthesis